MGHGKLARQVRQKDECAAQNADEQQLIGWPIALTDLPGKVTDPVLDLIGGKQNMGDIRRSLSRSFGHGIHAD
jgi:hypothetical protein